MKQSEQLRAGFAEALRRPGAGSGDPRPALEQGGPAEGRRLDRSQFQLAIGRIRPDADQVRIINKGPEDPEIQELAESIRTLGVIESLVVRYQREDDIYELVAGERRLAAATLAGLPEVPVKLVEADDRLARRLQLHENIHRRDLTAWELSLSLQELHEDGDSPEEIARFLHKSPAFVSKALAIAKRIVPELRGRIAEGASRWSMDALYAVAQAAPERQPEMLQQTQGLPREQTRQLIRAQRRKGKVKRGRPLSMRGYRESFQTEQATVTVAFRCVRASRKEIEKSLREALRQNELRPSLAG